MPARSAAPCIRCRQVVEINESAISICVYVRTVGVEPALRSPQDQAYCCSQCAVAMVMGSEPPGTQPLNLLAYNLIRNMVSGDLAVIVKAWSELRKELGLPEISEDPVALRKILEGLRQTLALPPGGIPERGFEEGEVLPPDRRVLRSA